MEIVSFQSGQVSPGIKYYTVDTEADKNNLPVGEMGNRCYVIESKKWYILNSNGEWVPFAAEGGAVDTDAILSAVENMTDAQRSQFISNLGFGTVFTFMGSVASRSDLPNSNNKVGYVYYVELDSSEYVWVVNQSQPNGYWEELGKTFEVTIDSELSNTSENPVQNKVINAALATKGTYSKPSGGIPKSDLASAVQTSLGKADTALQTAPVSSVNGQTGAVVIPLAKPGNTHINVFNPEDSDVEQGYLTAQGRVNYNADYWTTGYIAVSKDDVVRVFFGGANKNYAYAAEFTTTEHSGFVSRTASGSYASYTVQNDGYVRLSIKTSAVAWADRSTVMVTINDTDSTYIAYGDMGANDGLMSAADKKKLDGLGASAGKKVFDKFLFIAYSSFGSRAPNSVPHFEYCAQRDYDWLKADVQPTSDGGLVCCHDSGFTLDSNGRVTKYNSANATEIYTMTLAQATALTYASYTTTHVASINDFLAVCKRYGKTPYITIRDAHIADVVVPALMTALDKYLLRDVAVINSSARASLDAVRAADKNITMSLFVNPFGSSMAAGYNYCLADGNTMLGYFYTQSSHTWAEFIADSTVAEYIANCIQNGIVMWAGIESDASHVDDLIEMGFSGVHTMQDRSTPTPTVITVTGTTPTITPAPNTIYNCGELTSLTISNPPATGKYSIIFFSGATPTTTVGIANFTAEANKRYKIMVEGNYATYDSWPYTPTP